MSENNSHDREEGQIAAMLRSLDAAAGAGADGSARAAGDDARNAALARLREASLAAFVEAGLAHSQNTTSAGDKSAVPSGDDPMSGIAAASSPSLNIGAERAVRPRGAVSTGARGARPSVTASLLRVAALLGAVAALIVVWFSFGPSNAVGSATPFSEVLANLRAAHTLELKVTKHGQASQVWVRAPGLVRWEDSPQKYRIAAGSRLWAIDEEANTAVTGDSPWFLESDRQIDLLGLLEVGIHDAEPLLDARPVEQISYGGRPCLVYRVELPTKESMLELEAFADAATKQLTALVAWPYGKGRRGAPLAELELVAVDAPVNDDKFVVAKSLTEDGRIGKIVQSQGLVMLRPMLAERWTPVCRDVLLRTGDWIRCDVRGPNAAAIRLSSQVELTLGPGTLVELVSPTQARVHTGEIQVNVPDKSEAKDKVEFELLAPRTGSQKQTNAKHTWRVAPDAKGVETLVELKSTPQWLAGFEGTSNNESLGSLVVTLPDGRNEPLAVGYHKVSVEIRDQIARTTIEESFVNNTLNRLEGVFHFPLPQDASISDFGMWIGNDLVEADIVEKQRAREIYETILRERRDPGLLEWTAGNLFKARVFPIEARSEKRIKIVYTQVLPLRNGRYRYGYGLRSEMLRTKPLRELSLSVTVSSAMPLAKVTCPTHSARIQSTEHASRVDFSAQEYTPDRDFEVVCEVGRQNSDVVVIPHRRGDDGYLLMQLTPPGGEGQWQRETIPNGKPLNLVLLCDTSASMDADKRKQQTEFVATMLASLGEKDRFSLAAADVETAWMTNEPLAPTADNRAKAAKFLEDRASLGWTNLEQAFTAVIAKAPADAQVVYIGDGIVSAGERDPAAFVRRLSRMIAPEGRDAKKSTRAFHAVTVGNVYEAVVLRGIASFGGSVRSIVGEQTPATIALELLGEMTHDAIRDLKVEFRGVKVAAVYPDRLPNLPAGAQQILLARYLPAGADQSGEVIVSGTRAGQPVRFAARVSFKDAEEGNSFIPRLWARSHLDHLLEQGPTQPIRDEIIALSEEFHIITPYTSLLVLETDKDRERFGVKKRVGMRDGERFFAEGKDAAQFALMQQQMAKAGAWRIGMRRQILQRLAALGRYPQAFQDKMRVLDSSRRLGGYAANEPMSYSGVNGYWDGPMGSAAPWGGGSGSMRGAIMRASMGGEDDYFSTQDSSLESLQAIDEVARVSKDRLGDGDFKEDFKSDDASMSLGVKLAKAEAGKSLEEVTDFDGGELLDLSEDQGNRSGLHKQMERYNVAFDSELDFNGDGLVAGLKGKRGEMEAGQMGFYAGAGGGFGYGGLGGRGYFGRGPYPYNPYQYTQWLDALFPGVDPPRASVKVIKPTAWPADAIALAESIVRLPALRKLDGGVEIRRTTDSFDPRWSRQTAHGVDLSLYSPQAWLTRPIDGENQVIINYCDAKERGVYSLPLLLGRTRASTPDDLQSPPLPLADLSMAPLYITYASYRARVEAVGENQSQLILATGDDDGYELRLVIDTAKHVVVRMESRNAGKVTSTTEFSKFVEIAGQWWAQSQIAADAKGRKTSEITTEVKALATAAFGERISTELAANPQVQSIKLPLPSLAKARQHIAAGSADFSDRITMMLKHATLQQWDDLLKELDAAEKIAAGKPGIKWLRTVLLVTMRRNEEARQRLLDEAKRIAAAKIDHDYYLAEFIYGNAANVSAPAELLEILNLLKLVYDRQPAMLNAPAVWQDRLAGSYDALGRINESLEIRKQLATAAPWDVSRQIDVARRLMSVGQSEAAYAWIQKELDRAVEREPYEDEQLRSTIVEFYRNENRWNDLLKFTTAWIARNPASQTAYQHYLSALVYNDHLDDAVKQVIAWLREAQIPGKLAPEVRARLDAAIGFAQGYSQGLSFNQMDERFYEPLAQTARFFARHKHHFDIAQRILDYRVLEHETGDRLRGEFLSALRSELAKLTPQQIGAFVGWSLGGRLEVAEPINGRRQLLAAEVPVEIWKQIAEALKARWTTTTNVDEKHALGESLVSIYANRIDDMLLPFLRERIAAAPDQYKPGYISALFDQLLARPWSEAIEQESLAVLTQLAPQSEGVDRLQAQVAALYRWTDAMIANRQTQARKELTDAGKLNELKRAELAVKYREFLKAARTAVAARLVSEMPKLPENLRPWAAMEQAYLDIKLDQNLAQAEERAWTIVGELPPKPDTNEDPVEMSDTKVRQQILDSVLRQRAFAMILNLSVRRTAAAPLISRVTKYLDAGIAYGAEAGSAWRIAKIEWLIALDRPDDLERELREAIRAETSNASWRKALALLLAERGKLDEPIKLFEGLEKEKVLAAGDFRLLSTWYLAANNRDAHERTKIESYKQLPENVLANSMYQLRYRWMRGDANMPKSFDEASMLTMKALFEKSAHPEQYLSYLRDLYTASRDFRLLQMLPDAVLGRSPQQIYAFLENTQSYVLTEVQSEATGDEILARIKTLRTAERTAVDLRALDLLEALVERRSSEVLNQPGPHAAAALSAIQRAFDRKWSDGEPPLMAAFLSNLGTLRDPKLADEQLREIRALRDMTKAQSREHLVITESLAKLLFNSYGKQDLAVQTLDAEMREYLAAQQGPLAGIWPHQDYQVLATYTSMLQSLRRFTAAETLLFARLEKPEHETQRIWLRDQLSELYNAALDAGGEVSLGVGDELLRAIYSRSAQLLASANDDQTRQNVANRLIRALDIGRVKKLSSTAALLRTYAFESLPAALRRQTSSYSSVVGGPISLLQQVLGAKIALQYVVERLEQYPQRLNIGWESAWYALGDELARIRAQAERERAEVEALEARVLKLTLAELRRDLLTGQSSRKAIFHRSYSNNSEWFWRAKADDFAQVAEEVIAERKGSGRRVRAVADYLRGGLDRSPRAIEIMFVAHRDGILDEGNQQVLVEWLQQDGRFAESIALLEGLMKAHPDNMRYRTQLMVAYHRSQRKGQLADLVKETDAYYHGGGRWTVGNIAEFGKAALSCELVPQAIAYLKEAIALHQRDANRPAIDDATLSDLYMHLATAHSIQGETADAVEAAMGAIISWGPHHEQRANALRSLAQALERAKDLPAYVAKLDADTAKLGRDNPIIRKALGVDFQRRGDHAAAVVQFRLALLTQPNDKQTHEALISSLDALGKKEEATRQLMALIDLDAHNLALYSRLAERMAGDPAQAERAATSLVEAAPNEAENHQALGELREKQNRWADAIVEWREVAELRRLEPTGLLRLAKAQVHEKQWDAAGQSLDKLRKTEWPSRFGNVIGEASQLEQRIRAERPR